MDYNKMHADWAMRHQRIKGRRVLIVGCNAGLDCRYFVDAGAKVVHGLDVDDDIGTAYHHPAVEYFKESAEAMSLKDNTYDLVYCFATMEHVPDIKAAFHEMARVTKPGGLIYSVASPLWNSRNGHHYPQYFAGFPWAHLRLNREQALQYLNENKIEIAPENGSRFDVAGYMLDPRNFNMIASPCYISVCESLKNFHVILNRLDRESEEVLSPDVKTELEEKGFKAEDLLAVTHTYIARKKAAFWERNIADALHPISLRILDKISYIKASAFR